MQARMRAVRSGKVLNKAKKLFPINSVKIDAEVVTDQEVTVHEIAKFFSRK